MSAEFVKLCFDTKKLIQPLTVLFPIYRSMCFRSACHVIDAQCFKSAHQQKVPLQRTSVKMYGPLRNSCFLACSQASFGFRTSSLQKLGCSRRLFQEINGPLKYQNLLCFDGLKGYKTCHADFNKQVDNENKSAEISKEPVQPKEKLSVFKRYKKMMKEYWYVLIPVHVATSLIWFGSFYYAALCGFDIVPFLEKLEVGETIVGPLRNSSLGYIAVASALYKLATPARYMVTLAGTTVTINYLTKHGLLKPVPSKAEIKSMLKSKFKQKEEHTKENS